MVPTAELDVAGGENYINLSPGDTYDFSSKSDYKTDGSIAVEITERREADNYRYPAPFFNLVLGTFL